MNFRVFLVSLIFVSVVQSAFSQVVVTPSSTKIEIDGKNFYLHLVKQGETLYSICKAYNVLQKDVILINPETSNGIKMGAELKIPVYDTHAVKRYETIFSISKMYNVDINDMLDINREIDSKELKVYVGQVIRMPLSNNYVVPVVNASETTVPIAEIVTNVPANNAVVETNMQNLLTGKTEFRVAMLLPFFEADNFPTVTTDTSLIRDSSGGYKSKDGKFLINSRSTMVLEFYQGALLAIDSLKKQGLNAKIAFYDTMRDKERMAQLLNYQEIKNADLIIGPFYTELVEMMTDFTIENRIFCVSPTAISAESLNKNPYLIQVNGGEINTVNPIVNHIVKQENIHVTVIGNRAEFDKTLFNAFANKLKTVLSDSLISMKLLHPDSLRLQTPDKYLKRSATNVVIITTANESFVNLITGQLNGLSNRFIINVYGLESWTKFVNLDIEYLHALEFRYASAFHIDYANTDVRYFLKKYKKDYFSEPTMVNNSGGVSPYPYQFAFLGYDITFFFISALKRYGENFGQALSFFQLNTLQSDFHFEKVDSSCGFKNTNFNIYKYNKDYTIVKEQ